VHTPVGSGFKENLTGRVNTGFSVRDSDVFQNKMHHYRMIRRYQGQVKGVILDWAGTVLDCGVYSPAVVFIDVFEREGVPITMEEARAPMGAHKRVHIQKITQLGPVRERWKAKHGAYPTEKDVERMFANFVPAQIAVLPKYTDMITGVVDTVKRLKATGLKIGSTTGFTTPMVEILKKAAAKSGYVPDCYVCADEVPQARPLPYMVWTNAIRLDISPISAIVKVDDTADGVREGLTAGAWSIGLARTGNYMGMTEKELDNLERKDPAQYQRSIQNAYEILSNAGAHYVVDDLNSLPRIIDDINRRLAMGEVP
jgi:phosphonoacetaldehyde hydrolase